MNVNACVPLNIPRNRPAQRESADVSRPELKDQASRQDSAASPREDKAPDGAR